MKEKAKIRKANKEAIKSDVENAAESNQDQLYNGHAKYHFESRFEKNIHFVTNDLVRRFNA